MWNSRKTFSQIYIGVFSSVRNPCHNRIFANFGETNFVEVPKIHEICSPRKKVPYCTYFTNLCYMELLYNLIHPHKTYYHFYTGIVLIIVGHIRPFKNYNPLCYSQSWNPATHWEWVFSFIPKQVTFDCGFKFRMILPCHYQPLRDDQYN